jgi:hypothetical protein
LRCLATSAVTLVALATAQAALAAPLEVKDRKEADVGDKVTLLNNSNFKVTGECVDNGGGDYRADTFIKAQRENLALERYGFAGDSDFDPGDGKTDITVNDAAGTMPAYEGADYYDFYAEGQHGTPLNGRMATGVHLKGADCLFEATFTGGDSGGAVHAVDRTKVDAGKSKTFYSNDDFKFIGKCVDNGGGNYDTDVFLAAKRNNLLYYVTGFSLMDLDFDANEPKVHIQLDGDEASGTVAEYIGDSFDNDLWAEGKGGKVLQARLATGVHMKGGDCVFSGILVGHGGDLASLHVVNRTEVDAGKTKTIYSNDDFKATGKCIDNGGGDYTADTLLAAKRNNLLVYANDSPGTYDLDFDEADPKININSNDASGTMPEYYADDDYSDFFGDGKGGEVLAGRIGGGVHLPGSDCSFAGIFIG